jgi:hypothetical protein
MTPPPSAPRRNAAAALHETNRTRRVNITRATVETALDDPAAARATAPPPPRTDEAARATDGKMCSSARGDRSTSSRAAHCDASRFDEDVADAGASSSVQ